MSNPYAHADLPSAAKRSHANLLASRDPSEMAQAVASKLRAEAELEDALADRQPVTDTACEITRTYPIVGEVVTRAGKWVRVARPWDAAEIAAASQLGLHIEWQHSTDPTAELDQGRLSAIFIGTVTDGPVLHWSADGWRRIKSRGNYGKRYASGGTWSPAEGLGKRIIYAELAHASPVIDALIAQVRASLAH